MMQGSPEWKAARRGFLSPSRFADLMGTPTALRRLILDILWQRDTGMPLPDITAPALQWGVDNEPKARKAYEFETGATVGQVCFCLHPDYPQDIGGSPDGLVGDDGGIEIKCPYSTTGHLETILSGMPDKHVHQIQGYLWITGRQWWDFVSYDPRYTPQPIYVQRIPRDDDYIARLQARAETAIDHIKNRTLP